MFKLRLGNVRLRGVVLERFLDIFDILIFNFEISGFGDFEFLLQHFFEMLFNALDFFLSDQFLINQFLSILVISCGDLFDFFILPWMINHIIKSASLTSKPDNIHKNISLKSLAIFYRQFDRIIDQLWILSIHMDHKIAVNIRQIRGMEITPYTALTRRKSDLIIHQNMKSPSHLVFFQSL